MKKKDVTPEMEQKWALQSQLNNEYKNNKKHLLIKMTQMLTDIERLSQSLNERVKDIREDYMAISQCTKWLDDSLERDSALLSKESTEGIMRVQRNAKRETMLMVAHAMSDALRNATKENKPGLEKANAVIGECFQNVPSTFS